MNNTLSVGSFIKFGWETFQKRGWFLVGTSFVIVILYLIAGFFNQNLQEMSLVHALSFIIYYLLTTLISIGVTSFSLKAHDNIDTVKIADLWHPQQYWQFLAAAVLTFIFTTIGFVLVIVPGIIIAMMLFFTQMIVVDRHLGPVDAMKESMRITKGHRWMLFWFSLAIVFICFLGIICIGVGLLVAMPIVMLAMVHAYRALEHNESEVTPAVVV